MRDPRGFETCLAAGLLALLLGGCARPMSEERAAEPTDVVLYGRDDREVSAEPPPRSVTPPPTEPDGEDPERPTFRHDSPDEPLAPGPPPTEAELDADAVELLEIFTDADGPAVRAAAKGRELREPLRVGDELGYCTVTEILEHEGIVLFDQYGEQVVKRVARYRPIRFLGKAAYAFNAPPGLRYRQPEDVIFRVDPTLTALELKEVVKATVSRDPLLRGSVEAATGRWSRCMEAELVETTIDSRLRARPAREPKLRVRPLVPEPGPGGEVTWKPAAEGASLVRRMGLHPTDWRWRVEGVRPGRTQLVLRLYAVPVLKKSRPGSPECGDGLAAGPEGAERVRTLQRRIAIEVAPAEWVDTRLPSPWLWSVLLPPAGLLLVWWRRRRGRQVRPAKAGE